MFNDFLSRLNKKREEASLNWQFEPESPWFEGPLPGFYNEVCAPVDRPGKWEISKRGKERILADFVLVNA